MDLDVDTASLVVERLSPLSRNPCASINRTWKKAVERNNQQHWLVEAELGCDRLWMSNLVTGRDKVVEPNLPPECVTNAEWSIRVLCSFQGLVLMSVYSGDTRSLVLGDPLLNKWINLLKPKLQPLPNAAAFCSETSTLMVSYTTTATFHLPTAEWKTDNRTTLYRPMDQLCCLNGVFWGTFQLPLYRSGNYNVIACYDSVNDRQWRIVKEFNAISAFIARSYEKMLLYAKFGDSTVPNHQLFEMTIGSNMDPKIMLSPIPIGDTDHARSAFYGEDDLLFWEGFNEGDKITVVSVKDRMIKKLNCTRSIAYCTKCYYVAVPGTAELLDNLVLKMEQT